VAVVALGGAVGALARWALASVVPDGAGFPWTTFATNVVGSGLLALLPALGVVRRRRLLALGLGTGALGGFTTLSLYAEQGRALLADGLVGLALAYLLGSLAACLAVVVVADRVATTAAERDVLHAEEGDR
jgi:CrcB protein